MIEEFHPTSNSTRPPNEKREINAVRTGYSSGDAGSLTSHDIKLGGETGPWGPWAAAPSVQRLRLQRRGAGAKSRQ